MSRIVRFFVSLAFAVLAMLVAESITGEDAESQAFPVLLVDTAVHNRLSREWEPENPYQHERGYCLHYLTEYRFTMEGPLVIYTLTDIVRSYEEDTGPSHIGKMGCPSSFGVFVFLHTHPPIECEGQDVEEGPCRIGGAWAYQCFPSVADMRTLNRSDHPFALIQCGSESIVPYWRTDPLPLAGPPDGAHR